jgi:hypothetical protein
LEEDELLQRQRAERVEERHKRETERKGITER